jgi:hypothetical protein
MVQVGTKIQKMTANSIIGAINDFNDRVIKKAYNMATYHKGNVPKFTGTANYGNNNTGTVGFTNPNAIPADQLGEKTIPSLSINDKKIIASTLWSAMLNVSKSLNKIRTFESYWYHREQLATNKSDSTGGTRVLKSSTSGCAVFKAPLPAVSGGSDALSNKSEFWGRSGSSNIELNPSNTTIIKDTKITASSFNDAVNNCYNEWYNKCYNANKLAYTFYTCHLNCHGNCHNSRSRR